MNNTMNLPASRLSSAAALISITGALIGCASLPTDPYAKPTSTAPTSKPFAPSPAQTRSGSSPPRAAANATGSTSPTASARAAVRTFTESFINWKFDGVPALKRALIPRATGPLAVQLRHDAESAMIEASRRASNQSNSGTIEAIAAKPRGGFLVVTRETAHLGDKAAQSGYFVYRASVVRVGDTYKLFAFGAVN